MTAETDRAARTSKGHYAAINGLDLYYEVHGAGRPLVLLHGGLLTIEANFGTVIPALARRHQVIAVELQGHGRTADVEREMTLSNLADDVAALLTHLGVERADVLGFSLGGAVALTLVIERQDLVARPVLASVNYNCRGAVDLHAPEGRGRMPTEADFQAMRDAYAEVAPDPDHFDVFAAKAQVMVGSMPDRDPDELRAIRSPTLVLVGDTDFVRLGHAVEMAELIPDAQLAVLPGTTHMGLFRQRDMVLAVLDAFLDPPA